MVTISKIFQKQFNRVLNVDEIDKLQIGSFVEWDSLTHFSFLVLIEEAYKIQFSVEEMSELKSLSAIIDALRSKGTDVEI